MGKFKSILLTLLPIFIVVAILAGVEIYYRLSKPEISTLTFMTGYDLQRKIIGSGSKSIFDADPVLGWKLQPRLSNVDWDYTFLSTNEQGLRYPRTIKDKQANSLRVMTIGDSVTFGFRIPTVWPDEEPYLPQSRAVKDKYYSQLLETELSVAHADKKVEVVPFGAPGYTSYQGLESLKRNIDWFSPDVVVIQFGWNDQEELFHAEDKVSLTNDFWSTLGKSILAKSQALMYISGSIHSNYPSENEKKISRVSKQDYVSNILEMCKIANSHGAKPIVIAPILERDEGQGKIGYNVSLYREALKNAVIKTNYRYLEIEQLTAKGNPDNEKLFMDIVHPSPQGSELLASELAKIIESL